MYTLAALELMKLAYVLRAADFLWVGFTTGKVFSAFLINIKSSGLQSKRSCSLHKHRFVSFLWFSNKWKLWGVFCSFRRYSCCLGRVLKARESIKQLWRPRSHFWLDLKVLSSGKESNLFLQVLVLAYRIMAILLTLHKLFVTHVESGLSSDRFIRKRLLRC